jgi:hypothetical protein
MRQRPYREAFYIMEGGYRPPVQETEVTNPSRKLEANFVEGYAQLIARNPQAVLTPTEYIARHKAGLPGPFGAVELNEGLDPNSLSQEQLNDPENYTFTFGAGALQQGDLAALSVPYAKKGRDALIEAYRQSRVKGQEPATTATFTWGLDGGLPIRVRVSARPYSNLEPGDIRCESVIAMVPLVQPPQHEGQPSYNGPTGHQLIESAIQKSQVYKLQKT